MQTLDRSIIGITDTIKVPWTGLQQLITPGPGHLVTVLGATGVGKSSFALLWELALEEPSIYLSLDSDLATQAARVASSLSGIPFDDVRKNVAAWQEFLLTRQRTLPMMIDAPVLAKDVSQVVESFEEFYSIKPELVVIDNLKDVVEADTYEAHRAAVRELHRVAKRYGTTLLVLHHINRSSLAGEGTRPPSIRDGQFTGEQDSEFMLGLWQSDFLGQTMLNIRVLKNRFGPHGMDVQLQFDQSRMRLYDF